MKKNVTVALEEETARWVRVEAAKQDLSVSAYLAALLRRERDRDDRYAAAMALYLGRKPDLLSSRGTPYPGRDQLHERQEGARS
jgi:hypothetical protein